MGDVQAIRYLHHGKGWSKKRIARELDCSVKTVRRVLGGMSNGEYDLGGPRERPVSGPIEAQIEQLLRAEAENRTRRKQRLTAERIGDILAKEHGYVGSEASTRRAVARVRKALRDPLAEAYVPLVYEPGVDAQVDFFEADVDYPDGRRRRHFLLVRACYSAKPFVYHAPGDTQEALFDGLVQAFEFFGGVFHHLWFDNLTPAVAKVLRGRSRDVQHRFAAFMAHYGFKAEFCGVGNGNEKGGVENGVWYAERNLLSPVPDVVDDDELTAWTRVWTAEQDGRRTRGHDRTIGELWAEEAGALMPLPDHHFDACNVGQRHVSGYGLVQDGRNFYSVPTTLVGQWLTLKRYAWTVELHDESGLVASHRRLFGCGQVSFQLAHYLPLLERKARAFDHAAPVVAVRASWPAAYEMLLRLLRARRDEAEGTREFIRVLMLHEHHEIAAVHEAVRQSLQHEEPSLAVVRRELERIAGAHEPPAPLAAGTTDHLPHTDVAMGNVAAYGPLCREVRR